LYSSSLSCSSEAAILAAVFKPQALKTATCSLRALQNGAAGFFAGELSPEKISFQFV